MKITFNSINAVTGVITNDEPLRQGNVGANTLTATFEGKSNLAYTATFNYTRSDDGRLKDIPLTPTANAGEYYYKFSNPWFFAVYGETTLTVYLKNSANEIVASGQITFPIEQTDFDDDPNITYSEYELLLDAITAKQDKFEIYNVRGYNSLALAEADSGLVDGQIVVVRGTVTRIYQVQAGELAPLDSVGAYLPLAGGTMTGAISQPVAPVADNDLANKKYVDDEVAENTQDIADIIDGDLTVHTAYHAEMDVYGRNLVDLAKTSDLTDGTITVDKADKATKDASGNVITSTYATKVENALKVDKTTTILGIPLDNNVLLGEFKTALGEATQSLSGLMSATDKARLDALHDLLEEDESNSVVDSINEILGIFNNYPEGVDIVTALAGKVEKVEGMQLTHNDYSDTEKDKVSQAYAHKSLTNNPHAVTFAQLGSKPTTLSGFGITDAYTKAYIDSLKDLNGWESELITSTPLINNGTIALSVLQGFDCIKLFARNTTTGEIDTDSFDTSLGLVSGYVYKLFDNDDITFTIGSPNCTFLTSADYELSIIGQKYTPLTADKVAYGETSNVEAELDKLTISNYEEVTHTSLQSEITATNDIEIKDDSGEIVKITGNEVPNLLIGTDNITSTAPFVENNSVNTVADGNLINTGNGGGAIPYPAINNLPFAPNSKVYVTVKARITNSVCNYMAFFGYEAVTGVHNFNPVGNGYIYNPVANQWYTVSNVIDTPTNALQARFYHGYADASTANGKVLELDYIKAYDVSDMIRQGVKNDNGVLFSALTNEEIREQLDIWHEVGYPTHINKLISKSDNLFNGKFNTLTSLDSENLVSNSDLLVDDNSDGVPDGFFVSANAENVSLNNGIFSFTSSSGYPELSTLAAQNNIGDMIYFYCRVKASSSKVRAFTVSPIVNIYHSGSGNWELLSGISVRQNTSLRIYVGDTRSSGWTPIEVDYVGAINITDLVYRGILPLGLSNAQYKEMLDNAIFDNVPLRESDFISVEPSVAYRLIKASENSAIHKVIEYTTDNQIVKVNSVDYSGNVKISAPITMNALTRKVKLISDLMDRPNKVISNSDFSDGVGWSAYNSSNTIVGGNLVNTGNGANATPYASTSPATIVHVGMEIYTKARIKVTNSVSNFIQIFWYDSTNAKTYGIGDNIYTPSENAWYEFSDITSFIANGSSNIRIYHNYADAETANGKVMEVDYVLTYNITEFKDKGVVDDNGTLFSRLTNSEIKAQMDLWVVNGFPDHVINALYPDGADSAIAFKYNDADATYSPQQIDEVPLNLSLRSGEYWQDGYIVKANGNAEASSLGKVFSAWNYGQIEAIYDSGVPADFKVKYAQNTSAQVSTHSEYLKEARERLDTLRTNQEQLIDKLGLVEEEYDSYAGITSSEYEYFGLQGIKEGNQLAIEGYGQSIQNLLGKSGTITASQTVRGVTVTYDSATGVFTANGTVTAGSAFNITLATGMDFDLPTGTSIQLMRYYDAVDGGTVNLNGSYIGYVLKGTSVSNRINENSEALYDPYINGVGALTPNHVTDKQQLLFQVWKEGIVFDNFKFKIGIYQGLQLRPFILPNGEPAKSNVGIYNKTANKLNLASAISLDDSGVTITYDPLLQEFLLSGTASATKDISLTATFDVLSGDRLSIKRQYQSGDITDAGGVLPRIKLIDGATTVVYNDIYKMTAPEGVTPTPDVSFNTGTTSADGTVALKLGITNGQVFSDYRFRLMIHDKSSDIGYVKYEKDYVGSMLLDADEKSVLTFNAIPFGILEFVAESDSLNLLFGDSISDLRYTILEYNAGIGSPNRKISVLDERASVIDEPFRNKVIAIWGDSRESNNPTSDPSGVGDQKDTSWPSLLAKKLHATVLNYGLSGGAWAENTVQQDAGSAIVNRVLTEDASASADVIIISSMNDFKLYTTLGSPLPANKDKTTFYGAIRLTFDRLANKYPGKKIWVVLPQKRFDETVNYGGGLYSDYRKAQIDVCREYGIPTIDLYNNFPNSKTTAVSGGVTFYDTNMLNDTHFSAVGNDLVAELVARALIGNGNSGVADTLPPIPTTDGTYTLKVTITGGVPVFSWVLGS